MADPRLFESISEGIVRLANMALLRDPWQDVAPRLIGLFLPWWIGGPVIVFGILWLSRETRPVRWALSAAKKLIGRGRAVLALVFVLLSASSAHAQSDPWSNVATKMATAFTGPIAKGFALVAIVVGGLQLAFSEGGGRRMIGGLIFGLGMALLATQFLSWLFT